MSVCYATLMGGHVATNTYCETPLVLYNDLMKRQSQHVKLTNERLFERAQTMRVERKKLELEENTSEVVHLCNAAKILSADYYFWYKKLQRRTSEYDKTTFPIEDSDEVEVRSQSNVYTGTPPHIFRSYEHR